MNKKMLAGLGIFFALAIGGAIYLLGTNTAKDATDDMLTQNASADTTEASVSLPVTATPGAYVDYSDTAIASAQGIKLLFFHAPWCPQCRAIDDDIRTKGSPNGVTIIKVDYDTNQALRRKYGITLQTSFVRINDAGELVEKYVAYNEPSLASVEKNLLN